MPLSDPPLNEENQVEPHDHPDIQGCDRLIRRISEKQLVDAPDGTKRLSSMVFKGATSNGGMSVDLEAQLIEADIDPRVHVTCPRWFGSIVMVVSDVRSLELCVGFNPLKDNPYHGEVWGSFSKGNQRSLCNFSEWFVEIPGVRLSLG